MMMMNSNAISWLREGSCVRLNEVRHHTPNTQGKDLCGYGDGDDVRLSCPPHVQALLS